MFRATLLLLLVLPFEVAYSQGNDQDYSRFLHTSSKHASLSCTSCHHRTDNSARPSFPGHKDCTGCHLTQFTTPNIPLCSICHESVNGSDPPRKAFTDHFKESFNVSFDHAQHMTGNAKPKNGCTGCHSSLRRGVAMSIPSGLNAHAGCYSCHTPDAQANGRDLGSCGVCHATRTYARTPADSPAYRIGFSHTQHTVRQRLNCSTCHNYTGGRPQRQQVSSPRAQEHFPAGNNSCATCHNGGRAFGGDLDFKNCRRCHTGSSFRL
jgi:c(7)-type cytochrome triheme protein